MESNKKHIGMLFIIAAIALLIPYTALTYMFEYPQVLREDTAVILTKFHNGGHILIITWFAFAITGLPLIPAYIGLGQTLQSKTPFMRTATTVGVIGLIVQMVGLLRWTFVVPMLADAYVFAPDDATRSAAVIAFKSIHQFAGVLLGEHLGQLFTIAWTVMVCIAILNQEFMPKWVGLFGLTASVIYLFAQAELFATVISGFPMWELAGFIGSTLWLGWLIIVGVNLVRTNK